MESMGSSNIPLLAAFFIGLMTAISPCPLATNITAIAFISRKIEHSKHTFLVGLIYTIGRMFTYVLIASLIVLAGTNTQGIALFLQKYSEKIIGPLLLLFGLIMLEIIKLPISESNGKLDKIKEKLSRKGYLGSFLLGVLFALAFCPFSGVLYFGMLIPLALKAGDAFFIPGVFAIATGLPVIIFSLILSYSVSKIGSVMNKVSQVEKLVRIGASIIFIIIGIYYIIKFNLVF
ncbi:MAG: aromatic aminobenezylarsenical efflux permease ArsG family transporter [archaeon]